MDFLHVQRKNKKQIGWDLRGWDLVLKFGLWDFQIEFGASRFGFGVCFGRRSCASMILVLGLFFFVLVRIELTIMYSIINIKWN